MANYGCATRTNYFRVTDEERYAKLFSCLQTYDDVMHDFTKEEDGIIYHGFGSYSDFGFLDDEDPDCDPDYPECNFDVFMKRLQEILPEDEAFIYMSSGNERLRYVTGLVIVCTTKEMRHMEINEAAISIAQELLGNRFTTQLDY